MPCELVIFLIYCCHYTLRDIRHEQLSFLKYDTNSNLWQFNNVLIYEPVVSTDFLNYLNANVQCKLVVCIIPIFRIKIQSK